MRSYTTDLHHFYAERGHAPTAHGFKKFPEGIVAIAMEYPESDHLGSEGPQESQDEMAKQLKQLVEEFHVAGYVHEDLRLPNVYHVGEKIKLLDFDWGGKIGEALYPCQTLTSALRKGLMITKDGDERVVRIS